MVSEDRWRKVSEEMPETGDLVLVANARYRDPATIGYLSLSGWNWECGDPMLVDPTHWRPLPAPPEED